MNHFQKTTKKVEKLRVLFFQIGLIVSCTLTFLAFEWTTTYSIKELPKTPIIDDGITEIPPITYSIPEKPAPKIEQTTRLSTTVFKVVPNNNPEPAEENPAEAPVETPDFDPNWMPVEIPTIEETPVDFAEDMPEFVGGLKEMYAFLSNTINYPKRDVAAGIEGTVYVQFIVGKDGKIKDASIKRGVSETLDKEAIRVVKAMPDWIPGKQRGRVVNVRYVLPIKFSIIK